jgi:hypothetical protein
MATSVVLGQDISPASGSTTQVSTGNVTQAPPGGPSVPVSTTPVGSGPNTSVSTESHPQAKAPEVTSGPFADSMQRLEEPAPKPVEDPGPPTLLGGKKSSIGGYGGVSIVGSSMKGQAVVYAGLEGALLVAHRLAIGLAGYGLATRIAGPDDSFGNAQRLEFGYGGLVLRYSFVERRPYYFTVGALVGGGGVGYGRDYRNHDFDGNREYDPDPVFVVEPSVGGHVNLTRWMRLGATVSYRMVNGIDNLTHIKEKDLSGFAYGGNIQLGWF